MRDRAIVITSISPTHHNVFAQAIAMRSWVNSGFEVVSMNAREEAEALAPYYPGVKFITTQRTGAGSFKAPYVSISAMIDHARESGKDYCILANSDIVLASPEQLEENMAAASLGMLIANRHDHNGDFQNPTIYKYGFDVFVIHRELLSDIPQSLFVMGQTWWDYWLPWRFIKLGHTVTIMTTPAFMHHRHPVQYDQKEWERMTEHFVWMERYPMRGQPMTGRLAQRITNDVYKHIMRHSNAR